MKFDTLVRRLLQLENRVRNLVRSPVPSGSGQDTFETVSKNISAYPATLAYSGGNLSTITYDLGSGLSIVKTLAYTGGNLTSVTLSGNTPGGIALTKTLTYTGSDLTGVSYGGA